MMAAGGSLTDPDPVVRFEGVHMVFCAGLRQPVWALRGLSLQVPSGAVFALLGPNGAGKTTAVACMLGLLEPQVGQVRVAGARVSPSRVQGALRWGVLLEDTRLPPFLSVRAALEAVCAIRRVASTVQEVDRVVSIAGIGDLLSRGVAALSKGQARRAGLAAVLVGDPPLLVLDEPSAGLDADARVEFEHLVRSLRDGRRTMIIASHMLADIESSCTHVAVMREGRQVLTGRTDDLLDEARRGQTSDVHVDAASAPRLSALGIAQEPSRFPGLLLLRSSLSDEELLATLARAGIVPRRVEPRVGLLSLYLNATRDEKGA
jgi:ABC-2 type transport system ATP-binding protein